MAPTMPKPRKTESASPVTRELIALVDAGPERKAAAEKIGLSRHWLDKIASGKGRMSVDHAEQLAPTVGRSLELVDHADPVSEFRRALAANRRDIGEIWHDAIWSTFVTAKEQAMKGNPKSRRVKGDPVRPQRRAAASSE
jgi:hypothetical protein